jgi:hypothetical protein
MYFFTPGALEVMIATIVAVSKMAVNQQFAFVST